MAVNPGRVPSYKMTDTVARLLSDLCKPGVSERRRDGEHALKEYVEAESRDLSAEAFAKFMGDVYNRITDMLNRNNDVSKRLGGIYAIDDLIDAKIGGDESTKTTKFAMLLGRILEETDDQGLLEAASATLGHLVANGGAMTADVVDREVKRAIRWLDPSLDGGDNHRHAAVLVLREMAQKADAVFNVHVRQFIENIWTGLRDSKLVVRDASVQALQACLTLVEKRETRYRVQWYYRLFENTMKGLITRDMRSGVVTNADTIHGSLLALGELLRHTGEFLLARYKEVTEHVLRLKDSKEKLIRRAVILLLPRLAAFAPERFAQDYLSKCLLYLIQVLKNPHERGVGFSAIAEMAICLARVDCADGFESCLPAIAKEIKDTMTPRKDRAGSRSAQCPEALECVGSLSTALNKVWRPYAQQLLESMISTGLTKTLVESLKKVAEALPDLLEDIQRQLLELLSIVLAKKTVRSQHPKPKVERAEAMHYNRRILLPGAHQAGAAYLC